MRRSSPWDEAARRGVEVLVTLLPDECGGEAVQRRDGRIWVLIDLRLSPVEQTCLLAHALVHLDRGTSSRCNMAPATMDTFVLTEEREVDAEVARWLVDQDTIWLLVNDMIHAGEAVTVRVVAGELGVTKRIARIALERLAKFGGAHLLAS